VLRLALARPKAVLAGWAVLVGVLSLLGLGVEQRLHRTDIEVKGTAGAKAD
jgi:energy-converting hydrogenase Eha subunit F